MLVSDREGEKAEFVDGVYGFDDGRQVTGADAGRCGLWHRRSTGEQGCAQRIGRGAEGLCVSVERGDVVAGVTPMTPANLSPKRTIKFWAKGSGLRVIVFAQQLGMSPPRVCSRTGMETVSLRRDRWGRADGDMLVGRTGAGRLEFLLDDVRFEQ